MTKSTDAKVQDFIDQTMMLDHSKYQILEALRKVVFEHYPSTTEKMMYGGIIFSHTEDWGGLFVYKNHVSFEFSLGYKLKDPENLLEGGGKYRRHLKIKSNDSDKLQKIGTFLEQVESLD